MQPFLCKFIILFTDVYLVFIYEKNIIVFFVFYYFNLKQVTFILFKLDRLRLIPAKKKKYRKINNNEYDINLYVFFIRARITKKIINIMYLNCHYTTDFIIYIMKYCFNK